MAETELSAPVKTAEEEVTKPDDEAGAERKSSQVKLTNIELDVKLPASSDNAADKSTSAGKSLHDIYQETSRRKPNLAQQKRPFTFLRMPTISVTARQNSRTERTSEFTEEPVIRRRTSLPGPNAYSPSVKLTKTNAAIFSLTDRTKTHEGGGRTSWETPIFASGNDVWRQRTRYDDDGWPGPSNYPHPDNDGIGRQMISARNAPMFSMPSVGRQKSLMIQPDAENMPSVSDYDITKADKQLLGRFPAYRMGERSRTILWEEKEITPGPAAYLPRLKHVKHHHPSFTIPATGRKGPLLMFSH